MHLEWLKRIWLWLIFPPKWRIEVDTLVSPKCFSEIRVIAVIEDEHVIKKILNHLDLWVIKRKPQHVDNAPPIDVFPAYDEQPTPSTDDYIRDPDYPVEVYF